MKRRIDTSKTCSCPPWRGAGVLWPTSVQPPASLCTMCIPCDVSASDAPPSRGISLAEAGKVAERYHILVPQEHHEVSIRPLFWP